MLDEFHVLRCTHRCDFGILGLWSRRIYKLWQTTAPFMQGLSWNLQQLEFSLERLTVRALFQDGHILYCMSIGCRHFGQALSVWSTQGLPEVSWVVHTPFRQAVPRPTWPYLGPYLSVSTKKKKNERLHGNELQPHSLRK